MITSFQTPQIHAVDSLRDVMSLDHEKLHQCSWLCSLESQSESAKHTLVSPATAGDTSVAPQSKTKTAMPRLAQLAACTGTSASAHAAAIQNFAAHTASALLDNEWEEASRRAACTTYGARSTLVARALSRLQLPPSTDTDAADAASGADATAATTISVAPGSVNSSIPGPREALVGEADTEDRFQPAAVHADGETEDPSPRTRPTSFSGDEDDTEADLQKPSFVSLYINDDSLSLAWLDERLATTVQEAVTARGLRACAHLVDALSALVPYAATSARAGDALLLLYRLVLSAQPSGAASFTRQAVLPLLYALPHLPWREDHLSTLSRLLVSDTLTAQGSPPPTAARNSLTTAALTAETAVVAATTTVHVHMTVSGTAEGVTPSASWARDVAGASGQSWSPVVSGAAETDSERFFDIPEATAGSSAPLSFADGEEGQEEEREEEEEEVEEEEEEEEEEDSSPDTEAEPTEDDETEDVFEDAAVVSGTDASTETGETLSNGGYSFGRLEPLASTANAHDVGTAPTWLDTAGASSSSFSRAPGASTAVSALAALGDVTDVTVHVEHVAQTVLDASSAAPLTVLLCPLSSPLPPSPTDATASVTTAVPLRPGASVSCSGPCRVLTAVLVSAPSSEPTTVLLDASLSVTIRLPAHEESIHQEVAMAQGAALSAVVTRLLRHVQRDGKAGTGTGGSEATDNNNSNTAPSVSATPATTRRGEVNELLHGNLTRFASAEAAATARQAAEAASVAIDGISDDELRRLVRCLSTDLPAVREALRIAAYVLWHRVSADLEECGTHRRTLNWNNKEWKEVLRRVHSASSSLGRCNATATRARFVLEEIVCGDRTSVTPKQLMAQIQQLFSTSTPTDVLRCSLEKRHATGATISGLLSVIPFLLDRLPSTAAALLVTLLTRPHGGTQDPTASSTSVQAGVPELLCGCGARLDEEIIRGLRTSVLALMGSLCERLDARLPLSHNVSKGGSEACGVLASSPDCAFFILSLSVLVLRQDARDAVMSDTKRCQLMLDLLPGAAHLDVGHAHPSHGSSSPSSHTAAAAHAVETAERSCFALSAALDELAVKNTLTDTGAEAFDGAEPELVVPLDVGVPHVGPHAYLSSSTTMRASAHNLPVIPKIRSSEPLMYPGAHRLLHTQFNVHIHLHRFHVPVPSTASRDGGLWIGLTPLPPGRSTVELLNDNKALLVRPRGEAQINGHTVSFPPFAAGDSVSFRLCRDREGVASSALVSWVVVVSLNGVEVLSLPAPKERLYLVVGSTEDAAAHNAACGVVGIQLDPIPAHGALPLAAVHALTTPGATCVVQHSNVPHADVSCVPNDLTASVSTTAANTASTPPTLLRVLGFADHVLHFLLMHAYNTVTLARTAGEGGSATASYSSGMGSVPALAGSPSRSAAAPQGSPVWLAWQWLETAAGQLSRRTRYLARCLEAPSVCAATEAPWHNQSTDRLAMAKWVGARCQTQLCSSALETAVTMSSLMLRLTPPFTEVASALVDVVATPAAPARTKSLALASLLVAIQGSNGTGLRGLDPRALWAACVPLASDIHTPGYRPRFAAGAVDPRIVVAAGGRRIEYKSLSGSGTQPTVNYAEEGIPMNGSRGDVISFSVRLQRGYRLDSLCRHYHIGVACCRPQSTLTTLTSHPGERNRQYATYSLSDYFNDAPDETRAELRRHHLNWMTSDIVYGSGDVVTVVVHTRRRTVGFARNGKYLGTLYRRLPTAVCVLFPFVELINRDSKAKWMHPVSEVTLYARSTLRAMLTMWWAELSPHLSGLVEAAASGDSTGLEVLGADGNELCMVYRSPPPNDGVSGLQNVRLVRMDGAFAIVEADGAVGAVSQQRVWAASLEPLFTAALPSAPPVAPLLDVLLRVATAMAPQEKDHGPTTCAFVVHPAAFLRVLRLVSTVSVPREAQVADRDPGAAGDEPELEATLRRDMQSFVRHLIWLLQATSRHTSVEMTLIEAFNEASWAPRDDTVLPLAFTDAENGGDEVFHTSADAPPPPPELPLLCPDCGEPWAVCTAGHLPPESVADLCDRVLHRLGVDSPFTGWVTRWVASPRGEDRPSPAAEPDSDESESGEGEPEGGRRTGGNDPVLSASVVRVWPDAKDPSLLHISCRCQYGCFDTTASLRSTTVLKGSMTFKQSGWVDDANTGVPAGEWSCEACTFVNEAGTTRCAMCTTARPGAVWSCPTCTYAFNPNGTDVCTTCGQLRFAGLSRPTGRSRDDNVSFCEECRAAETYHTIRDLRRRRFCTTCARVTTWLPKRKHMGTMSLRLSERGDTADLALHVDKVTLLVADLCATSYSTAQLAALVEANDPQTPLSRYVPAIAALRNPDSGAAATRSAAPSSPNASPARLPSALSSLLSGTNSNTLTLGHTQGHMRTAIIYYASLIALKWAPVMDANLFVSPAVLKRVRVFEESWLSSLDELSAEEARLSLQACFRVLFFASSTGEAALSLSPNVVPDAHVVATASAVARALIRRHPSLQPWRSALLYALARIAAATPEHVSRREVCCMAITNLFEDAPLEGVNVQSLSPIHSLRPMVPGQRRTIVYSLLHGASLENPLSSTTATCCLVKALDCMSRVVPVPAVLDMDVTVALPYTVALAETTLNEGGDLQVGQVRGSLGVSPTTSGKYYYEVVLPANLDDNNAVTIVMGWGTQQHEHLSSTQHVGSDLHSWGFNCRDRLRLMMTEQLVPTRQTPSAGDVIGSMMDLSTMMVCWTINGEEIMWVSVPSQGDSERIYPYVSASVEPCGVEVRLAHTQFRPEDYQDYSAAPSDALWGRESHAAPARSYDFYRQLSAFLSEAGISELDMTNDESVGATLATTRKAQQELEAFPAVRAVVQPNPHDAGADLQWPRLNPYIAHLRGVSNLAVQVTQVFSSVKASPFLSGMYDKARDLFLSGVRWTVFESQIGIRPTFLVRPPMTVEVDIDKAAAALQRVDAEHFAHDAATRFADSVTGQLFAQTRHARIYKNATMFAVKLAGDVTVDGGGVTRSVLSMIADELSFQMVDHQRVDPAVPLFKLCGHSTIFTVVPNMALVLGVADPTIAVEPFSPVSDLGSGVAEPGNGGGADAHGDTAFNDKPPTEATTLRERQAQAAQAIHALTWLGRLIGNLTLCGTLKLPVAFPRLVWKFLTFKDVTMDDYFYDIDDTVRRALDDEDFLLDDDLFYAIPGVSRRGSGESGAPGGLGVGPGSADTSTAAATTGTSLTDLDRIGGTTANRGLTHGVSMAALAAAFHSSPATGHAGAGGLRQAHFLTPAASMAHMSRIMTTMSALDDMDDAHLNAQADEIRHRREAAQQALLHQFDPALQAIRTGLTSVIPASALTSIRWDDLQSRVCGSPHCSADQILAFMDCTRIPDDLKHMLTTTLDDFSDKQRSLFLLFCAGQSRLPLPEQISVSCGDDPTQLPTAHTCSPISLRLPPCETADQLRAKLEVCLQNAQQFGFV